MRATAMILARVEDQRLSKAAEGIRNGTYRTMVTLQTGEEVRGFVKKGNDKEYGCTITPTGAYCSCPDALYRGSICKHAVTLALYVLLNSTSNSVTDQARTNQEERRSIDLRGSVLRFPAPAAVSVDVEASGSQLVLPSPAPG
jgi:predicted nucleic acid-binding Zn finger protein